MIDVQDVGGARTDDKERQVQFDRWSLTVQCSLSFPLFRAQGPARQRLFRGSHGSDVRDDMLGTNRDASLNHVFTFLRCMVRLEGET